MRYSFLTIFFPLRRKVSTLILSGLAFILCLLMAPPFLVQFLDCMNGPAIKCIRWDVGCSGYRCFDYDYDGDNDVDLRDWSYIIANEVY